MSDLQVRPSRRRTGGAAGVALILVLVGIMWLSEVADYVLPVNADMYGILPRTLDGLDGILWAPFLHAGFGHLMSNTVPLLVLGLLVAWRAGRALWKVLVTIVVLGGFGVWLLSPPDVITIGASGLVFGLLGYLLAAGIISRHLVDILLAVGVLLVYGSTLWAATPFGVGAGVSWLAHLAGFAAGAVAALWFAPRPQPAAAARVGA